MRGVPNYGPAIHKIYHQVTWQTTPLPLFYVWEVTDVVEAHVSGANFETYHRLRDLESMQPQLTVGPGPVQAIEKVPVGNQKADAWIITTSDFVRI